MIDNSSQSNGGRRRASRRGSTGQTRAQLQMNTCGMIAMARSMPDTPEIEPFPLLRPPRQERRSSLNNAGVSNARIKRSIRHSEKQQQQRPSQPQHRNQHHQHEEQQLHRRASRRNSLGHSKNISSLHDNSESSRSSESVTRPSYRSKRPGAARRGSASHGQCDTMEHQGVYKSKGKSISNHERTTKNGHKSAKPRPSGRRQMRRASLSHVPQESCTDNSPRQRRNQQAGNSNNKEKRVSRDSFGEDIFALSPNNVTTTKEFEGEAFDFDSLVCGYNTNHIDLLYSDDYSDESTKPVFKGKGPATRRASIGGSGAFPKGLGGTNECVRLHRAGVHVPYNH
jgi:hypothetical protein